MNSTVAWCSCCGSREFATQDVLWPELIAAWELRPDEVCYINRQQGLRCTRCGSSLRSMTLASALMVAFDFDGLLSEFVKLPFARGLRVLEINPAGELTQFLRKLPGHQLTEYPYVDMQQLPFADGEFAVVIHSDTLEHVPNPRQGLSECRRVLQPGGLCLYTVPMVVGRLTRDCHGRPPSYHGSPKHPQDCRVFTEFGADAWALPLQAGFQSCRMHCLEFPTSVALVAEKAPVSLPPAVEPAPAAAELPAGERLMPRLSVTGVRQQLHRYAAALRLAGGCDVLDIACGEGYGTNLLAGAARTVVGVDIDAATVAHARSKYQRDNLRFQVGRATKIPLPDASVDLVTSFETLQHITEQSQFLAEIRRVLRPDGLAMISTSDRSMSHHVQRRSPCRAKELTFDEFRGLLTARFRQCVIFGQREWRGSILGPVGDASVAASEFFSHRGDFREIQSQRGVSFAEHLVAFVSNRDVPISIETSLFECPNDLFGPPALLSELEAQVQAMLASTSWRITAPLRALSNWWRGRSR